jgi:hypothetical protein
VGRVHVGLLRDQEQAWGAAGVAGGAYEVSATAETTNPAKCRVCHFQCSHKTQQF